MQYRSMTIEDYDAAIQLWQDTAGVRLRDADSKEGIARYLDRNPGLSRVAVDGGHMVGTVMAGHDGKRGYIQHLAVADDYRRRGVASRLVADCLEALRQAGIIKSHVMILRTNALGESFWNSLGWQRRSDVELFSFINGGGENV
ncbi:GNAT family N-acetyltransferase [Marinobacter halodurans]|uniref:GNAT family N-acetyltransferase n=1 Tax=Marinobacter halodurans TaxID=2528979 RepID=A0ABY1ZIM7_9GAMM|nr:GNAT family N-acetyltransferase [Marinobacter halodurans]TBW51286.1 GNAT family N-acetyltransferase [Marinobacter halodurans]